MGKFVSKIKNLEEEVENIIDGIGDIAYKNEKFKKYTLKMIHREIEKNINNKIKLYNEQPVIIIHPQNNEFTILLRQAKNKYRMPFRGKEINITYEPHTNKTVRIETDKQIIKVFADSGILKKWKIKEEPKSD